MPTYIYHCTDCGNDFEEFQKITDKALEICPQCEGHIERVITGGVGFIFKGNGFYITDHRNTQYKKDAAADTSGKAGSSPPSVKASKKAAPKPAADTKGKGSQSSFRSQGKKGG
jgi:putative FmdB family regulatory protein